MQSPQQEFQKAEPKIPFLPFRMPSPVTNRSSYVVRRSSLVARRASRANAILFLSPFVLTVANPFRTTEIQPPKNRFRENRVIILCWPRGDAKSTTRIPKGQTQNFHFSHFTCPHQSPVAPRLSFVDRRSSLAARRVSTPSSF